MVSQILNTHLKTTEIGVIPEEWEVVTIAQVCEVTSGGTPSRSQPEFWNGDIPWVKTGEINYSDIRDTEEKITQEGLSNSSAKLVPRGTLLMAMYGQGVTRGKVAILSINAAINQACLAILQGEKLYNRFLYYWLTREYQNLREIGNETTQKNLNASIVKQVKVPLPPIDEQKKIAEILGSVDEAIASTQAVIDQTRKVKQGLLQQLLTKGIGHTKFKESAIGKIPKEWQIVTIEDVCEWIGVGIASAATHAYTKDGIPMIRNQNIKEGYIDTSELLYINTDFDLQNQTKRIKAGDVLTVRTGYPGLSAVVPPELDGCHCFTSLISRPQPSILNANFLCWWINSDYGKSFVLSGQAGGAQQNLNVGVLRKMLLPLPSIEEQAKISDIIFNVLVLLRTYEEEIEQHKRLKIALMQDLLTGKVRVKQT